jgi:hypothetical protein
MVTPYGTAWWIQNGKGTKQGLVLGLHGGGEGAGDAGEAAGKWSLPGCIGMYPQGIKLVHDTWNTVHGERFLLTLIEIAKTHYEIDPDRVYSMGFSMGGTGSWFLAGRHLTLKCDGDTQEGAVFGGPIFYGNAGDAKDNFNEEPTHPGNLFWHQAQLANKLFAALDGKQREKALLTTTPKEEIATVRLKGAAGPYAGLAAAEMSKDQKGLIEELLKSVLGPYRASDVAEAMKVINDSGGVDKLSLSYYSDEDLGKDGVWDNWMIQGPKITWFFRGNPHVHTWVNVGTAV